MLKCHRQLSMKDLPKVPTWRLERESNPRPFGRKASTLPKGHHAPHYRSQIHIEHRFKFSNRSFAYAAPALWNGLPKDLRQFAHSPNRSLNFTYPPLALSSATFHSQLKTELFKISYPGSTPAPRHVVP